MFTGTSFPIPMVWSQNRLKQCSSCKRRVAIIWPVLSSERQWRERRARRAAWTEICLWSVKRIFAIRDDKSCRQDLGRCHMSHFICSWILYLFKQLTLQITPPFLAHPTKRDCMVNLSKARRSEGNWSPRVVPGGGKSDWCTHGNFLHMLTRNCNEV